MLGQGTHAGMGLPSPAQNEQAWAIEYDEDQGKYKYNSGRGFYRGEKVVGKIPGGGYLTNKKWHLNEVQKIQYL